MIDWPSAVAIIGCAVPTGGVIIAAVLKYGKGGNGNGNSGVPTAVCLAKHTGIDASLGRLEASVNRLHERMDDIYKGMSA
jgi:hypothetical protein